jgi:hypothetical protein
MNSDTLQKCSKCGCKKLLKLFKFRENTGEYFKTCIQCGEKSKKGRKLCLCGTIPSFGLINDKIATCCSKCKTEDMVDLKHKRCICGTIPYFGLINDKIATCCSKCKTDGMVNIKDKHCICGTIPSFGLINDKIATCCSKCKTDGMLNIKDKHCLCGTRPSFGLINDKIPTCCAKCKTEGMVNIKDKHCKTPHCDTQISNPKYKGHCSRCFFFTYPDTPITRNYKTKENTFIHAIHKKFNKYTHRQDHTIKDGCSKKRPDNITDFGSHIVIIEIDENRHRNYECEIKRMTDLFFDTIRPTIFLRLNPDSYTCNNKRVQGPFVIDKETGKMMVKHQKELDRRLTKLYESFEYYTKERNYKMIEVVELFFE